MEAAKSIKKSYAINSVDHSVDMQCSGPAEAERVSTMASLQSLCRTLLIVLLVHSAHCFSTDDELLMAKFNISKLVFIVACSQMEKCAMHYLPYGTLTVYTGR